MTTTLITGANKGLGYETARRLISAGHTVYLGSRNFERGRAAAERIGALPVQLDVTNGKSVAAALEVISAHGALDVLINNAGIAPEWRPDGTVIGAPDLTAELVELTFGTNVVGAVRMLEACLPLLVQSEAPVVVNVSSGLASMTRATTPGAPGYAYPGVAYPASKSALNMITIQFAKAFPSIRINAVEPGFTATDLNGGAGHQTLGEGAQVIVAMAQVTPGGPTGGFFSSAGRCAW